MADEFDQFDDAEVLNPPVNPRATVRESLKDFGASDVTTAAILGDIEQESKFNPNAVGDRGTSFGLLQVGRPLFRQFKQVADAQGVDPQSEEYTYNQPRFILDRFKKQHPDRWEAMQNAPDAPTALSIFRSTPGWGYGVAGKRFQYANQYEQQGNGKDQWSAFEDATPEGETPKAKAVTDVGASQDLPPEEKTLLHILEQHRREASSQGRFPVLKAYTDQETENAARQRHGLPALEELKPDKSKWAAALPTAPSWVEKAWDWLNPPTEPIEAMTGGRKPSGLLGSSETPFPIRGDESLTVKSLKVTGNIINSAMQGFTGPEVISSLPLFAIPGAVEANAARVLYELPQQVRQIQQQLREQGASPETIQNAVSMVFNDAMQILPVFAHAPGMSRAAVKDLQRAIEQERSAYAKEPNKAPSPIPAVQGEPVVGQAEVQAKARDTRDTLAKEQEKPVTAAPAAAVQPPAAEMTLAQFNAAAERGKMRPATGKFTPEEEAARGARPFESGMLAGYSLDDIAHFYKNFPGLEPGQAYRYFIEDAKAYAAKPAIQPGMFLEFGGERHPVQSIADASERFVKASGAAIMGKGTEGVPIDNRLVDSSGKVIGRISPNGRVWNPAGDLIYDPGAAPKLRPGEKATGELFQGADQPFNLAGEAGVDVDAQQRLADAEAKRVEKAKADAEKAQTIIPFDEFANMPDVSPEEEARLKAESEAGLLEEVEEHLARGGDELMDVLKSHGLPLVGGAKQYVGELNRLRGMFKSKAGLARLVQGDPSVKYSDIFKKSGKSLDSLTDLLRSKGFPVDGVSDVLDLIEQRLRTGKKVFGSEARAELDYPESGFPNVGLVAGPGFLPFDQLWKIGQRLNEYRKGLIARIRARPTRDFIAGTWDGAYNKAGILGDQAGNEARLAARGRKLELRFRGVFKKDIPLTMDEQAMIPVINAWAGHPGAAGTPLFPITYEMAKSKMYADAQKVISSPKASPEFKRLYAYALKNFDTLAARKGAIDRIHQRQLLAERAAGIDTDDINGYVAQRWDFDVMTPGKPLILDSTGGKGGSSNYFRKQRVFPDHATAIAAGYKPKSFDIGTSVNNRVRAGQYMINKRLWIEAMKREMEPISGKPILAEMIKQPKGTMVPPPGYSTIDLGGNMVAVNEYAAGLLRALNAETHFPKFLSKGEAFIKHGILLFDTFHMSRLAQMQGALMSRLSYMKGLSLLEYSDSMLDAAVRNNEITAPMAEYARTNRKDFNGLVTHGLNAAQVTDALYRESVQNIPGIGGYTKFLFDKFNRGIIAESGLYMLERNRRNHPDWSERELYRKSAYEANVYFRNLRSQGIFKRKTWQDAARFSFLAPQWYEGMITSELMGYGQMLRAPYDSAVKGKLVHGNIAHGMGKGILAYMVGTQVINMLTRGYPTWENPEQGQQWSAWVPDFLGDSNGFFLNPMGVFAEMTHDVMKYSKDYPNKIDVAHKIIQNKYSPIIRAMRDFTGHDYFGRPLDTIAERAMQAGADLLPIPIGARSLSQQYAGSQERTLSSSLGFKLDVAASAGRQMRTLAKDYAREHGVRPHDPFPSEYRDLTNALRDGDMDQAQQQYEKLRQKKSRIKLKRYYDKLAHATFTGSSKKMESGFRKTLGREQIDIYNQAVEDAKAIRQRFYQLERR